MGIKNKAVIVDVEGAIEKMAKYHGGQSNDNKQ